MVLLIAFAFLAGIITVLSPCILPILPIVLTSSIGGQNTGKARPLGVVSGFILSFTFFTLFLSTIVRLSGIGADTLRLVSVVIVAGFGVSLLVPQFQALVEKLFARLAGWVPVGQNRTGFGGGLLIGVSVGLLWTPCVGPILASVISLAITGTVTLDAGLITLAYSMGTAMPMLLIMLGGQSALRRVPWLMANLGKIQKAFGVVMILTALGIFLGVDRKFQTWVLEKFPQYGAGLTKLEDNELIKKELKTRSEPKGVKAPELRPVGAWFNSAPLTIESLRGKVVIVDFWTYSCINCQRTLPYLRQWWKKYKDKGLVIIGVHSPEFEFEKSERNVAQAIADFGLTYPIVQDNDFATWQAYNNRYWPAKYFIDKEGFVRYTHFGEGNYDESEKVIQDLLGVSEAINNTEVQNFARTPEIYLGNARRLPEAGLVFEGKWEYGDEYANPARGARLVVDFEAKEVFAVMRAKKETAKVEVFVDDERVGEVTVDADKLYQLLDLPEPGKHELRLEFGDSNAEVYAFTFG